VDIEYAVHTIHPAEVEQDIDYNGTLVRVKIPFTVLELIPVGGGDHGSLTLRFPPGDGGDAAKLQPGDRVKLSIGKVH
jgi:hypothetical protein